MFRHYRGTALSEKLGINKASSKLGHADIRTTKRFYDHSVISDEEFLSSLEDYES
jgi:integrase